MSRSAGVALVMFAIACGDSRDGDRTVAASIPGIAARFVGGELSVEEVRREQERLPPSLRDRFDGRAGLEEVARGLIDKRLLVLEARRRGFADDAGIAREVRELEERLIVQALLRAEETSAGTPSEGELRAFFEEHREEFRKPESRKVHVLHALAPRGTVGPARAHAERFAQRLRQGEPAAEVAKGGGLEPEHAGVARWIARGDLGDRVLEEAAFALRAPGDVSPVIRTSTGFAVVQLIELQEERPRTFEEVRAELEPRLVALRQRAAFDSLLQRLRANARIEIAADQLR